MRLCAEDKYHLIRQVITKYKLKDLLSYLCSLTGTSRSGYYRYFSEKGEESHRKHEERDEALRKTIQKAYDFKKRRKGAMQIKTTLAASSRSS